MRITVLFAALLAVVVFGGSPVAAKFAVHSMPALDVALLRTVIGGLVAIPVALALRIGFPAQPAQRTLILVSGFCGYVGFPVLFTFGILLTTANHGSMILATLPIFTGAIAMTWDRVRPARRWWLGSVVSLAGALLLVYEPSSTANTASIKGDLLVLLGNVFASTGYVAGGRLQRSGYSAMGTAFWGVAVFAMILLLPAIVLVDASVVRSASVVSLWGLAYLAIGVTIVGYILWYWALGTGGIARVGLIQFLQPVSGVLLAFLLLGERLDGQFLFASTLILAGVWIAISKPNP